MLGESFQGDTRLSSSDDFASPGSRFSGDDSGQFFDLPDVVRQSPLTLERVVDTQSGFLIVLKQIERKIALSVKRRVGTPPTSVIAFTPDESLQLSVILAHYTVSQQGLPAIAGRLPDSIEQWLSTVESSDYRQHQDSASNDNLHSGFSRSSSSSSANSSARNRDFDDSDQLGDVKTPDYPPKASIRSHRRMMPNSGIKMVAAASALVGLCVVGLLLSSWMSPSKTVQPQEKEAAATVTAMSPLDNKAIDKFARSFVGEMLDFNKKTYRTSQVKAMAHMSPAVLDKYWKETRFPADVNQLNAGPNNQTLMITNVSQERLNAKEKDVDIFAELVSVNSKISSPVHLKLTVSETPDNEIEIQDLQDLTVAKK
jgi:hypothetical protein